MFMCLTQSRKYVKQNLTAVKGETDSSPIIVGDFSIALLIMSQLTRQ